jgi:hypothetical protein
MSRRKKIELSPQAKKEARRLKSRQRREARKNGEVVSTASPSAIRAPNHGEEFWAEIKNRLAATKILDERDNRRRPYWLSIPFKGANPPVADYHPCSMFKRGSRWYFGFLFREHRDSQFKKWPHAKKEITE